MVDIITDSKINPSLIITLYDIHNDLKNRGLTRRDIVTLCMDRLRRKSLKRAQIDKAIDIIIQLEKKILKIHGIED